MSKLIRTPVSVFAILIVILLAVPQSYAQQEITVKEWDVPTPGSAPHDIVVDGGGIVWYTAIGANKIGRFDQETGTLHEYDMPTPNTTSRFIYADSEGKVWFPSDATDKIGVITLSQAGEVQQEGAQQIRPDIEPDPPDQTPAYVAAGAAIAVAAAAGVWLTRRRSAKREASS